LVIDIDRGSILDSILDPELFWPLDPGSGMGKKSRSGMNIPDHISESLETIFSVKIGTSIL
jgi:hypothetical protein